MDYLASIAQSPFTPSTRGHCGMMWPKWQSSSDFKGSESASCFYMDWVASVIQKTLLRMEAILFKLFTPLYLNMNTSLSSLWWALWSPNGAVLTMDTLLPSHQWIMWSPNGSTWSAASPTFLSVLQSGRATGSNVENKALEIPSLEESYLEWHVQYAEHILWHSDTRNTGMSYNIVTPKTQERLHVVADTQDTGLSP